MRIYAAIVWIAAVAGVASGADEPLSWRDRITLTASERLRGEFVDWFGPPQEAASERAKRYSFFASQTRVGARTLLPHAELVLELQDTRLANLPDDASLPPPHGNLGTGALYFAHTRRRAQGEPFLKQGFLTLRRRGIALTFGRFDYRDGLETVATDPSLAFLKRARVAERLVGPFDFTHVTRSFDGVRVAFDRPSWNATAFAAHPSHGGFEVSANREISEVSLAGLATTLRRLPFSDPPPADLRLFYLFYRDGRASVVKVDNRPLLSRRDDREPILVHTAGTHALTVIDTGVAKLDGLAWAVIQDGEWGVLDHRAWAYALEIGGQLPRLPAEPWLRVGIDRSSGDDDPADGRHGTFFQVLPTSRIYAQFPFFNLMNVEDIFAQLILRPDARVTVRADYHWLELAERRDLWYGGGGATNDEVFGFSGIPTGGRRSLAHLVDASMTLALPPHLSAQAYYGYAFGQSAIGSTFADRSASYGFLELTLRY